VEGDEDHYDKHFSLPTYLRRAAIVVLSESMSMDDKQLQTAEYDSKGLCIRHPTIRLRKKKLFGGWKIIIGHCPECCLDEMRRVRDQIERQELGGKRRDDDDEEDGDEDGMDEEERESRRIKKEKKKKKTKSDRHKEREHRSKPQPTADESSRNLISEAGGAPPQQKRPVNYQQQTHYPAQQYHQPPPPQVQQRTMVLSMAFIDPQTGNRGTYTGQVNSLNYKPDGKGTVYFASGIIAEGTWVNGILVENENAPLSMNIDKGDGGGMASELERMIGPPKIGRGGGVGGSYGPGSSSSLDLSGHSRIRATSSQQRTTGVVDGYRASSKEPIGYRQQIPGDFTGGNLDKLDRLNRRSKSSRTRGAAASVQSYNSRGSVDVPSGSASVQAAYGAAGGETVNFSAGGSLVQGFVGGGSGGPIGAQFQRRNSGYKPRHPSENRQGSGPPEYR
jgi:hypothetical protein